MSKKRITKTPSDEQQNALHSFAKLHGLSELNPVYLTRMQELTAPVALFGQQVRRLSNKADGPAPVFVVMTRN
jgi:hypothetical protein